MNDQGNPFLYGRPVEQAEELIDREGKRAELQDSVRSGQPVMVYGPRRYRKTGLARVVEREASDGWGIVAVQADL
jgi:AAA+ ATPase superfamily predicted ATPase